MNIINSDTMITASYMVPI